MELEASLLQPRAERTAVSTTPVPAPTPASEEVSGDTSFATPRSCCAYVHGSAHRGTVRPG
eukprot:5303305-Heterocapsa_arctica.AAC.1